MTDGIHKSGVRDLAYTQTAGEGPGVVFLGGLRSDKEGSKALYLEAWAQQRGRAFLRFDYSGHGQSSGTFEEGAIGDWYEDAVAIIEALTEGPQVLVGSSMGGWVSLLIARERPDLVAGLVTIAAAPDFTEDGMWSSFDADQRAALERDGFVALPSEYSEGPYIISKRLIEEGRDRLVLRDPLHLPFATRFLHGLDDVDVELSVALRLMEHVTGEDIRLTLVKGADHRFSTPECLAMIVHAVDDVTARAK